MIKSFSQFVNENLNTIYTTLSTPYVANYNGTLYLLTDIEVWGKPEKDETIVDGYVITDFGIESIDSIQTFKNQITINEIEKLMSSLEFAKTTKESESSSRQILDLAEEDEDRVTLYGEEFEKALYSLITANSNGSIKFSSNFDKDAELALIEYANSNYEPDDYRNYDNID